MSIERVRREGGNFAVVPNEMLRNSALSIEARGFLALLMSYGAEWNLNKSHLMEVTGLGRDKFERVMKELRDAGYVEWIQERGDGGHLAGSTWVIRDEPADPLKNRVSADPLKNRHPAEPTPGFSGPLRRTSFKKTKREEEQDLSSVDAESGSDLFGAPIIAEKPKAPDRFEEFWSSYPQCKRKTAKPKAKAAFERIVAGKHKDVPKTDPGTIIAAIKARHGVSEDPVFIPMPTTWLNDGRFIGFEPAKAGTVWRPGDRPFWGDTGE